MTSHEGLERFVREHGSTVLNALESQARRMTEAAELAEAEGGPGGYARLFREQAGNAREAAKALCPLVGEEA